GEQDEQDGSSEDFVEDGVLHQLRVVLQPDESRGAAQDVTALDREQEGPSQGIEHEDGEDRQRGYQVEPGSEFAAPGITTVVRVSGSSRFVSPPLAEATGARAGLGLR